MSSSRNPREEVAVDAGLGGYGKDFVPQDREYQEIRMKARSVMEGRAHFTYKELEKALARFLVGR